MVGPLPPWTCSLKYTIGITKFTQSPKMGSYCQKHTYLTAYKKKTPPKHLLRYNYSFPMKPKRIMTRMSGHNHVSLINNILEHHLHHEGPLTSCNYSLQTLSVVLQAGIHTKAETSLLKAIIQVLSFCCISWTNGGGTQTHCWLAFKCFCHTWILCQFWLLPCILISIARFTLLWWCIVSCSTTTISLIDWWVWCILDLLLHSWTLSSSWRNGLTSSSHSNSFLHVLQPFVIVHQSHEPELMPINCDHLNILLTWLILVMCRQDLPHFLQRQNNLYITKSTIQQPHHSHIANFLLSFISKKITDNDR